VHGATSSNNGPEDQLSTKHDLKGPSVMFGRRNCPSDQGLPGQSLTTRETNFSLVCSSYSIIKVGPLGIYTYLESFTTLYLIMHYVQEMYETPHA